VSPAVLPTDDYLFVLLFFTILKLMEGINDLLVFFAGDADHTEVCLITQKIGVIFLVEVYILQPTKVRK